MGTCRVYCSYIFLPQFNTFCFSFIVVVLDAVVVDVDVFVARNERDLQYLLYIRTFITSDRKINDSGNCALSLR